MLSQSVQDYLKTIFELRQMRERVTTNALAEQLEVAPASVTGMIKKLAEMKLVEHTPYQGVSLTASGEKMALAIVRHHRLIELYLTEALGYSWDKVHEEADRLEHAISEEFADKISTLLGDPKVDPHGDPIPSKDGTIAAFSVHTLDQVPAGHTVRIERVRDEVPEVLRHIATLGLLPGTIVDVSRTDPENTLTVALGQGVAQVIPHEVARSIYVVDVS